MNNTIRENITRKVQNLRNLVEVNFNKIALSCLLIAVATLFAIFIKTKFSSNKVEFIAEEKATLKDRLIQFIKTKYNVLTSDENRIATIGAYAAITTSALLYYAYAKNCRAHTVLITYSYPVGLNRLRTTGSGLILLSVIALMTIGLIYIKYKVSPIGILKKMYRKAMLLCNISIFFIKYFIMLVWNSNKAVKCILGAIIGWEIFSLFFLRTGGYCYVFLSFVIKRTISMAYLMFSMNNPIIRCFNALFNRDFVKTTTIRNKYGIISKDSVREKIYNPFANFKSRKE